MTHFPRSIAPWERRSAFTPDLGDPRATAAPPEPIAAARITQATTATFSELPFSSALLVFIQQGEKRVLQAPRFEATARPGDVLVFPQGAVATIVNRAPTCGRYEAIVIRYPEAALRSVFDAEPARDSAVQLIGGAGAPETLRSARAVLDGDRAPPAVAQHRLLEPLLWLKAAGVSIPAAPVRDLRDRIRRLVETDLAHPWRAPDIARRLAVSEPTLRRHLRRTGARLLTLVRNTRLECGLAMLQTTERPIAEIAAACGFATPSHFTDCFRSRFDVSPRAIRTAEL